MNGRRGRAIVAACAISWSLLPPAVHAANMQYKVIGPAIFEMQEQLDQYAKEGWRVRSMAPLDNCRRPSFTGRAESFTCFVIVLEREAKP